jgi:hypothetical protein
VQQALRGILGRRLAGTHHPVDFDLRLPLAAGGIGAQGVGEIGAAVDVVDVKRWNSVMPAPGFFPAFPESAHRWLVPTIRRFADRAGRAPEFCRPDIRSGPRRLCTPALTRSRTCLAFTRWPAFKSSRSPIMMSKLAVSPCKRSGTRSRVKCSPSTRMSVGLEEKSRICSLTERAAGSLGWVHRTRPAARW